MVELYSRRDGEFRVNAATAENQLVPAMARLASGGFVIVWTSQNAPGGGEYRVRGQLYAADGSPVGGEFAISPATGLNSEPRVAALSTGGFVVTWTYDAHDGTGSNFGGGGEAFRVEAQLFDAAAAKVGGELTVATGAGTDNYDSQVTGLANGAFAVSWTRDTFTFSVQRDAVAQVFDSAGAATSARTILSASANASQSATAIAALAGGGFVATWSDSNSASSPDPFFSVRGQLLDAAGAKVGGEFFVNTTAAGIQTIPSVAALASGGFVVTWTDLSKTAGDTSGAAVRAQIFDAGGVKLGGELLVNTTTAGDQSLASVAGLPNGGFIVAWRDGTQTEGDVRMQAFDSAGAKQGAEFLAHSVTQGLQNLPVVIGLADGGFAAAWADQTDHGGSLSEIKAQIFMPGTGTPGDIALSNMIVSETAFENDTVAILSNGGPVNGSQTYALVADGSWGGFRIEGDRLVVADNARLDFEGAPSVNVTVRVTETGGASHDETFALAIADNPAAVERRYASDDSFVANLTQAGETYASTTIPLAGGGFAVLWTQFVLNGVFNDKPTLRFFDASGAPVSGEILVAPGQVATGLTAAPRAEGGLVVAYTSSSGGGSVSILAQAFDAAGNAVGPEMVAGTSTTTSPYNPHVVQLSTGGYVLSWTGGAGLHAQRFDGAGAPVGGDIELVANSSSDQHALVATPAGGFVAAWAEGDPAGDGPYEVRAQFFDSAGAPVGAGIGVAAGAFDADGIILVALAGGGYMLGWAEQVDSYGSITVQALKAQHIGADGSLVGGPATLASFAVTEDYGPDISFAAHPGGGFVATWPTADLADPDNVRINYDPDFFPDYSLRGRLFDANGAPAGMEFQIAALAEDGSVAILADGTIASTWTGADSQGSGIEARLYHPANAPVDNSGNDTFSGDAGDNVLDGGPGNDFLLVQQGGSDVALGGDGNDVLYFGAALSSGDVADGGAGRDSVVLQGNVTVVLTNTNMVNVESLSIQSGANTKFGDTANNFYDYNITMADGNVAAGQQLIVNASSLRVGEDFTFDGSAEHDGKFLIYGGFGVDTLKGGDGNDILFFEGGRWGSSDTVDGGAGRDALVISGGNGLTHIEFGATSLAGIESISLNNRLASDPTTKPSYELVLDNGNVTSGGTLILNGNSLTDPTQTVSFDGHAVTGGNLNMFGGAGIDTLIGGAGTDILYGAGGKDTLTGGGGADVFQYRSTSDSTTANPDTITDFVSGTDKIDLHFVDADTFAAGDQAFHWIGGNAFTGGGAASAGELRAFETGGTWFVEGDTDGNGIADFALQVTTQGNAQLGQGDFLP